MDETLRTMQTEQLFPNVNTGKGEIARHFEIPAINVARQVYGAYIREGIER